MTIKRFLSSVLVLALLIVAAVHLSHRGFRQPPMVLDFADLTHADHYFIGAHQPEVLIECPVTTMLDWNEIWEHEMSPCSLGDGWMLPNTWGSQIFGKRAQTRIELSNQTPRILVLRLKTHGHLPENVEQTVRIFVNGQDLGQHPVSRKWHAIRQPISQEHLLVGRNEITLEFAHATSLRQAGISKDSRAIAAKISRLALLTPSKHAPAITAEAPPTGVWDNQRQEFAIRQSGTLVLPLLIPPGANELEFDVQPTRSVDLSTAEVVFASEDLDGRHRQRVAIDGPSVRDRGRIGLPVHDLAGRWALVTAEVTLHGGQLMISPPRIVFAADEGPTEPSPAPAPIDPEARPDIVLITLDAARADSFSFAGYDRKTSPFIDSIAKESLVFPNAYALAPYTLCSVPTMITGLSPFDHGVINHEDVLSEEAVTLAEFLQKTGYLTAGFSATPNNSKSKGFAQGYDVFREIWTEAPKKQARKAHFLAHRVVDWLDSVADDDRPLHLQVHMIPPHSPYDPPTRFDLFTDPAYDGPCDGYSRTISTIDGRETPATTECIEHLLNLYDGNLRTADDATRIIVRALQRRPRWKDTVVLITSDHGEAFMEHGMLAHNSTVYGEMLHVPFVLRLPPNQRGRTIDTNRLVTLADIVPTLLGTARVTITEGGSGVDLLAPNTNTRGRAMVARTTSNQPYLGLRTLRWSLILNATGSGALFDLSVDPDELDSVSVRQPVPFVGLGRILTRRIGLPPKLAMTTESADITEDDRELLEALGYIRD